MAVPKKRTSVSRKGLRRAGQHHKLYRKHTFTCPNCSATILPHRICDSCGQYRGKQFLKVKTPSEEGQESTAE